MIKIFKPSIVAVSLMACFHANSAVYEIENLNQVFNVNGTIDGSRSGFGVAINEQGQIIGGASGRFAPVLSNEDRDALDSTDIDVILGTQATVASSTPNPKRKPESNNFVFEFDDNNMPSYLSFLEDANPSETVGTTNDYVFDLNNSQLMVGTTSAPAVTIADPDQSEENSDRDDDFWVKSYHQRAMFADNGQVSVIEPPFATYGGQSGILAVNDSGMAVGYASTALERASEEAINDRCLEDWQDIIPLAVCTSGFGFEGRSLQPARFVLEAYQWQISNGQVVSQQPLGKLAQPIDEDDYREYNSIALDINSAGIAVGRSQAFRHDEQKFSARFRVATVFRDGEIIDLMDHDNDDWLHSVATGINDNNLVIGQVSKNFSGFSRDKFFVHDLDAQDNDLFFPLDFEDTESDLSTMANDINIHNMVVGNVEIDSVRANNQRRTHGFIYDHNLGVFSDLNDMLTCRSKGFDGVVDGERTKYQQSVLGADGQEVSYDTDIVIVDAKQINDDGSIIATALVRLPMVRTQWVDVDGNVVDADDSDADHRIIVTDSSGQPIIEVDSDGKVITEQLPRAIVLRPTSEALCETLDQNSSEQKFERSGAPMGWSLLFFSAFGLISRRFSR